MSEKLEKSRVDYSKMSAEQREAFSNEICELVGQIFIIKDRDRLFKNYAYPASDETRLWVFRNGEGRMVGFQKVAIDHGERNGKKYIALNSHAGFLRAYRGASKTVRYAIQTLLGLKFRHPTSDVFYFGALVHPSSYALFSAFCPVYWPRYDMPTPPEQEAFMCELANPHAGPEDIYNKEYPLVRYYYLGTITLPQEQAYWANSEKPEVQYFLEINPLYGDGAGVFTWVTVDRKMILAAISRAFSETVRKRLRFGKAALLRTKLGRQLLPKPKIEPLLRKIPDFDLIPDSDLAAIAETAELHSIKPGRYVMKAGDLGDSMYIIIQGSAYVLIEDGDSEVIVDQLGKGNWFGEMALMSGEPRSASVRSVTPVVMVRVTRDAFRNILDSHPEVSEIAWDVFGQRRLDKYLIGRARFSHMEKEDRVAWYKSSVKKTLQKEQVLEVPASKYLFFVTGSAEVRQGENWSTVNAPSLHKFSEDWRVHAETESRVCVLDEPQSHR